MAIPQKRVILEGSLASKTTLSPTRIPRALQRKSSPATAVPTPTPSLPPPLTNLSWKFSPDRTSTLKPKLRPKTRPLPDKKGVGPKSDPGRISVRIKKVPDKNNKAVPSPGLKGHAAEPTEVPSKTCSLENLAESKDPFLLSTALIREAQKTSRSADTSEDAASEESSESVGPAGDVNNNRIGLQDQNQDGQYSFKVIKVREESHLPTTDRDFYRASQVIIQDEWNHEKQQQRVAKEYQYHLQMISDAEANEPTSEYHREIRQLLRKLNVAHDKPHQDRLSSSTPDAISSGHTLKTTLTSSTFLQGKGKEKLDWDFGAECFHGGAGAD